jgi:hypothetical protein
MPLRLRLTSAEAWSDVAQNFRTTGRWSTEEVLIGFLLAGFVGLLGNDFFNGLFIVRAPEPLRLLENVLVGPLIAILSFVCSVGNVPLAAVLWSGGISFAGVIAFVFADLLVLPIVAIYRKYYGGRFALRIVALMFVAIVISALLVNGLFGAAGLIPHARPTREQIFSAVKVDYRLFTNIIGLAVFTALFALSRRGGVGDAASSAAAWPEPWPTNDLLIARAMTFAERAVRRAAGGPRRRARPPALSAPTREPSRSPRCALPSSMAPNLGQEGVVLEAGRRAGIDAEQLRDALSDADIKVALRRATDDALAAGVFGVPTIVIGEELFWGDDRLDQAAAAYRSPRAGRAPAG